jgi:hypothetical protein
MPRPRSTEAYFSRALKAWTDESTIIRLSNAVMDDRQCSALGHRASDHFLLSGKLAISRTAQWLKPISSDFLPGSFCLNCDADLFPHQVDGLGV